MTNADIFKNIFGLYATELWSMPEKDFLKWLNSEVSNCSESPNGWISCDERLPEGSQIVLLSLPKYIDDYGQEFYASVICGHYIGGKDCEWGISDGSRVGYGLVSARYGVSPIAWMPLPAPYRPKEDES